MKKKKSKVWKQITFSKKTEKINALLVMWSAIPVCQSQQPIK